MYSDAFCKVYNEFGWNYFPEAFGEELMVWIRQNQAKIQTSLDLACGTGILCEVLHKNGIQAAGMDFSEGMIEIARSSNPAIAYEVADMITYRPDQKFDLVTCTGDALNHIIDLKNVEQIFRNVYAYLSEGGYFIFDILNEKEVSFGEPIDLDFSDTVKAQFMITQDQEGMIRLKTTVFECVEESAVKAEETTKQNAEEQMTEQQASNSLKWEKKFEEIITETVHDVDKILEMLTGCGFHIQKCGHSLLDEKDTQATTWYIIARK